MDLAYKIKGAAMPEQIERNIWKIGNARIETSPQVIAGQLFAAIPDLEYRSIHSLQQLFIGLLELSIEMAEIEQQTKTGGQKGSLTRFIKTVQKQKTYIPDDRTRLLTTIFDLILRSEGLGLLNGFGFANEPGNPERVSNKTPIYEFQKEKEKIMATKKKDEKKIKRSELIAAGKELNMILAPDPEIEVGLPTDELTEILVKAKALLEPTDTVTPAVQKTLDALPDTAGDPEPEPEPEPEEVEITDKDISVEKGTPAAKKKEAEKAPAKKKVVAATPPVEKERAKPTRANVMKEILQSTKNVASSKTEMVSTMQEMYGGSENEAAFQVGNYVRLLIVLGLLEKDTEGKFTYNG